MNAAQKALAVYYGKTATQMDGYMSGEATKLADFYIQALMINGHTGVINDGVDRRSSIALFELVLRRLESEHTVLLKTGRVLARRTERTIEIKIPPHF